MAPTAEKKKPRHFPTGRPRERGGARFGAQRAVASAAAAERSASGWIGPSNPTVFELETIAIHSPFGLMIYHDLPMKLLFLKYRMAIFHSKQLDYQRVAF